MNILGNIKKVITSYSNPNDILNPIQNTLNIQSSDYSTSSDNNTTINVLKDESKYLKEKYNQLQKENELLKQSIFTNSNQNNSQITKIFKEFKSAFFSYDSNTETNKSIRDFKNFLFQNMLLYNSVEEEDIDVLNAINITDNDWNNNKDVFIFKQNLLERNYNQLMENLIVSNELNSFLKENDLILDKKINKIFTSDHQKESIKNTNNYNDANLKNSIENKNSLNNNRGIASDSKSENNIENLTNKVNSNSFGNANEKNSNKQSKNNILEDLIKDDDLQPDLVASIFSKSVQEKHRVSNENAKSVSSNSNNKDYNNNTNQFQMKSDYNSKQNSNKNTFIFDELLEPDVDFLKIKDNLSKEVLVNEKTIPNKNITNTNKTSLNNIKDSTNTTEIISNILKDKKNDIESLVHKTLVEKNSNKISNVKPGRIKSPLDDEEEENEEYLINEISTNNIQDLKIIGKITENNKLSNVIENVKKDLDILREKQIEIENNISSPSKNIDLEIDNLNYVAKKDVKETETPFNTPMNSEHFSEPKSFSNTKLGKILC